MECNPIASRIVEHLGDKARISADDPAQGPFVFSSTIHDRTVPRPHTHQPVHTLLGWTEYPGRVCLRTGQVGNSPLEYGGPGYLPSRVNAMDGMRTYIGYQQVSRVIEQERAWALEVLPIVGANKNYTQRIDRQGGGQGTGRGIGRRDGARLDPVARRGQTPREQGGSQKKGQEGALRRGHGSWG
jgi:hypothetical protein